MPWTPTSSEVKYIGNNAFHLLEYIRVSMKWIPSQSRRGEILHLKADDIACSRIMDVQSSSSSGKKGKGTRGAKSKNRGRCKGLDREISSLRSQVMETSRFENELLVWTLDLFMTVQGQRRHCRYALCHVMCVCWCSCVSAFLCLQVMAMAKWLASWDPSCWSQTAQTGHRSENPCEMQGTSTMHGG